MTTTPVKPHPSTAASSEAAAPAVPAVPVVRSGPGRDATAWLAIDLERDPGWMHRLDDVDRAELLQALRDARIPGQALIEYDKSDFRFGERLLETLRPAFDDTLRGRGVALIKGLPRDGVSPEEFELMTWAIGLQFGVARPQDRLSRYMNQVKDVGVDYRSASGRGYSSNAELDFHIDGADIVLLSCYNQAIEGGDSLCASSVAAFRQLCAERPDLAAALQKPYPYSLQGEQQPGQAAYIELPVVAVEGGDVFCGWNRNRVANGAKLDGAPRISDLQREAMDAFDAILRRREFMYSMRLEAGDLQLLNNHTVLHSRTGFRDHEDEATKRTLYRLWLSLPDAPALPRSLAPFWGSIEPGVVRGGIRGHLYDDARRHFDARQSAALGMRFDPHAPTL